MNNEKILKLKNEIEQISLILNNINQKLVSDSSYQSEFDKLYQNKVEKEKELLKLIFPDLKKNNNNLI
jgi:hypothetical protein